ncbi:MAG: EhaG family protein [Methanoculleaceae archaeon]
MAPAYPLAITVVFATAVVAFCSLIRETDDLHRLVITDLVEVISLAIIALIGTDLAEALILPGLVVGISELTALSEIYRVKEALPPPPEMLHIEVMDTAPAILGGILVTYGIILSGFGGGAIAGVGIILYFMCRGHNENFSPLETASGYAWAMWIAAFVIFMLLPEYWLFGVMVAGTAILLKVITKMSLIGTMRGGCGD